MIWEYFEDEYGKYKKRVNEFGRQEIHTIERKQKWYDENPPLESPHKVPVEYLLAEQDRQIQELKVKLIASDQMVADSYQSQQELIEVLIDMGVL